jgi:hypothetical protein
MKLLILEVIMSLVYIFDVSSYPFIHVPFYLLTLLYVASILEIYGMVGFVRFISRKVSQFERRRTKARVFLPSFLSIFSVQTG